MIFKTMPAYYQKIPFYSNQVVNTGNSKEQVSFMRELGESHLYQEIIVDGGVDTVSKAFEYAVTKYGNKECLGTRKVLGNTKDITIEFTSR